MDLVVEVTQEHIDKAAENPWSEGNSKYLCPISRASGGQAGYNMLIIQGVFGKKEYTMPPEAEKFAKAFDTWSVSPHKATISHGLVPFTFVAKRSY